MAVWGNAVQEHYVKKFRKNFELRKQIFAGITTKEAAQKYVDDVRAKLRSKFSFPAEKCDLNVRRTGFLELADCNVEKIIFDSRPGFPVSAAVYLPKKIEGKHPAVLLLCGHALEGKAASTYQTAGRSLAKQGVIVACPDPVGQGERKQYYRSNLNNVNEHNVTNRRLLPMGDNTGNWRTYDAIRSVDYLLSRDDVDASRIGVSGNSGGGTMTTMVNAVEDRFAAANPNCYITRWWRNVENELPVDAEQILPGAASDGGDMADLLIAAAPRPLAIGGQANDFFDIRGTKEVYEEVKQIYTLLGYPERVRLTVGPVSHGYSPHLREASYHFYRDFFGTSGEMTDTTEPMLTEKEISCTPTGRTIELPGTVTIHDLIAEQLKECTANAKTYTRSEAAELVRKNLRIGKVGVPTYRQLRDSGQTLPFKFSRYGLELDESMVTTMFCTSNNHFKLAPEESVELYVPALSSTAELANLQVTDKQDRFAIDYRGVGESTPDGCDQDADRNFFAHYKFDYHYASLSLLMDESYLGDRVRDVLGAIELLTAYGAREIKLTCSGIGRIPALFAALLTERNVKYMPDVPLNSLCSQVLDSEGSLPQSMIPVGLLKDIDFPEIEKLVR